jgi:hypothetical protein
MKTLSMLGLVALALALSGCGKKEEYKYELSENGCSTGKQELESKSDMCTRLKDNGANNGCAYTLRKQRYEQDCGSWQG